MASCSSRKSFQASGQSRGVNGTSAAADRPAPVDFDSERTRLYAAGTTSQIITAWTISRVTGPGKSR